MNSRNKIVLENFTRYCVEHPEERFWQALRNWSGYAFVYVCNEPITETTAEEIVCDGSIHDTFYWEGKDK